MSRLGETSGWITDSGEILWTDHTGDSETEIHHVDLSLSVFGKQLGYPGRDQSHYNDGGHHQSPQGFWEMYGMRANELAMRSGWIMWVNEPDENLFFAFFTEKPSKAALDTLYRLVGESSVGVFDLEWSGRRKPGGVSNRQGRSDQNTALDWIEELQSDLLEEIEDIRRRAGLCD